MQALFSINKSAIYMDFLAIKIKMFFAEHKKTA